jgi:hypothetical protein
MKKVKNKEEPTPVDQKAQDVISKDVVEEKIGEVIV